MDSESILTMTRRSITEHLRGQPSEPEVPADDRDRATLSEVERALVDAALPFTMTGTARIIALIDAVRYCIGRDVRGDFVECGVWRGGSVLAMIMALQELAADDRDLHLFDTFEGMTEPSERDTSRFDEPATAAWARAAERNERAYGGLFADELVNLETVRRTVLSTRYPTHRVHFVRGPVQETIPAQAPEQIALLRLDTDWYESTRHELEHLYPRLVEGGVLIIDDYGHWDGCRRAVDEFFASAPKPLLHRIDYTARIAIKH